MKAYLVSTGVMFGALVVAHIWRVIEEGPRLLTEPLWVAITAIATVFCGWAFRLLWRARRRGEG